PRQTLVSPRLRPRGPQDLLNCSPLPTMMNSYQLTKKVSTILPNTERFYLSAQALHLPVKLLDEIDGFEIVLGKQHYYFSYNELPFNNSCSARIAVNKFYTNKLLENAGIPVPKAAYLNITDFEENLLDERIADLKFPLVIKPLTGSLGMGVLCNIQSPEELNYHLKQILSIHQHLLIEEFHANLKSYRVLVFNRKVIGVILCHPAHVVGNGRHNLKELIDLANISREALDDPGIGPILVDEECKIRLKELKLTLDYIPANGERVVLAYTSNGSRGGSYESLGKQICRENRQLMIQVATQLNLNLTGIDIECEDINRPIRKTRGVILEVNHRPDVRIHEQPSNQYPLPVSRKILRSFIYRHPLAYLYALFSKQSANVYLRVLLASSLIILFFWFIRS
ncbi:hypothetical protein, partial [Legionella birminghamensis]